LSSSQQIRLEPRSLQRRALHLAVLFLPALVIWLLVRKFDVTFVLGATVALGMGAVMFAKPEAATLVTLFVMYANLSVVAIYYHNVPQPLAASFFMLLGIPLSSYLIIQRQMPLTNRALFWMLVYFAAIIASAIFSREPAQSVERVIGFFLEGIVLYFLILNTIRTPALLRKATWVIIAAGVLMGSLSLYQSATGAYNNSFGGMAQISNGTVNAEEAGGEAGGRPRLSGPLGEQNRYAQVMIVLLPLAGSLACTERSRKMRLLAMLACIPILSAVLLTYSRGAFVAIVVAVAVTMYLHRTTLVPFLIVISVLGLLVTITMPEYVYRITSVSGVSALAAGEEKEADSSMRGRATENLAAINIFLDHPLLGAGPGQAKIYITAYGNEVGFKKLEGQRRAHSMYLEELADTGLIGFACFMAIALVTVQQLARVRRYWAQRRADLDFIISGFLLAIIAYLCSATFLHLSYQRYFWLLLAMAGAAIEIYRPPVGEFKAIHDA
jgi:O-antigen ligase